jgi:hypothetical protein
MIGVVVVDMGDISTQVSLHPPLKNTLSMNLSFFQIRVGFQIFTLYSVVLSSGIFFFPGQIAI